MDWKEHFKKKPVTTAKTDEIGQSDQVKTLPKSTEWKKPKEKEAEENDVKFGQQGVSKFFSTQGKFKGVELTLVAEELKSKKRSPDELPIEYILRDGVKITLNNRSLTALTLAGLKPTNLIDRTGNVYLEKQLTERLAEMGGIPGESMQIRKTGTIAYLQ
ncbi:hypothetical protein [Fusibacter sp. 3D3]|uniref:hypothetical protein n=1 Tax=Fusibacter sp. 3D3 TaxID=1048380 RepID=UPI001112EE78|nr:hypothetical protein [Fusibacter sp. 3D3]